MAQRNTGFKNKRKDLLELQLTQFISQKPKAQTNKERSLTDLKPFTRNKLQFFQTKDKGN